MWQTVQSESSMEDDIEIEFVEGDENAKPELRGPAWVVAEFSTDRNILPLEEVSLIGLVGFPGDMKALVRMPSGGILTIHEGDDTEAGEVLAILEDTVLLKNATGFVSLYPQPDMA